MASSLSFKPLVCIVDFHHARGPEVERWFGVEADESPESDNDWSLLPFLALSDGAHAIEEEFSYFTLRQRATDVSNPSSLFGVACTRQLDSTELLFRPSEVTRSSVQKAVVAIVETPFHFGRFREKLSAVTQAWFLQRDFRDVSIIEQFHESLVQTCSTAGDDRDQYFGMSLRELIHEYRQQTLILFKCALLQKKMLFYGTNCEKLCLLQFTLVSLIPGLLKNLQDCADPSYNTYEQHLVKATSLKSSDRSSLLAYMGLPLQLFGKGSLFGPYTPLQALEILADANTTSYIVGSTNSLLLQQKTSRWDVLVNLEDHTVSFQDPLLKSASYLSASDRRWIDFLSQSVATTWDPQNPSRPSTLGYAGSEEFIRAQFEEYLLALLSSVKYHSFVKSNEKDSKALLSDEYTDPIIDFGTDWTSLWQQTENYRIFTTNSDSHLFDIVTPRHPTAGGLTIDDIQRRVNQQISDLHLDARFADTKEIVSKNFAVGQERLSKGFNKIWSDIENLRERQRRQQEVRRHGVTLTPDNQSRDSSVARESRRESDTPKPDPGASLPRRDSADVSTSSRTVNAGAPTQAQQIQAQASMAASKAGAYIQSLGQSWGSWAVEKRNQAAQQRKKLPTKEEGEGERGRTQKGSWE